MENKGKVIGNEDLGRESRGRALEAKQSPPQNIPKPRKSAFAFECP